MPRRQSRRRPETGPAPRVDRSRPSDHRRAEARASGARQLVEQRPGGSPNWPSRAADPWTHGTGPHRRHRGARPAGPSARRGPRACTPPRADRRRATSAPRPRACLAPRSGSLTSLARICSSRPRRSIRPVTSTIRSVSISSGHRLVDAGERHDLDAAREPLQPELRVRLAALRVLARERADDAADRDEVAVAEVSRSPISCVVCAASASAIPSSGWSVTNCPSISFSFAGAAACRTRAVRAPTRRSPATRVGRAAEQRELPGGLGLALGEDRRRDLLEAAARRPCPGAARRAVAERVERARRRSATRGRASSGRRRIDLAAEVGERRERAVVARASRIALHGALARRCARPTARSGSPARSPGAGAKSVIDSFTSGGKDLDAHAPARVQVVRLAVLVVLDRREDRRHVLHRMVRHQVRGLVRDVAVGAGVRRR